MLTIDPSTFASLTRVEEQRYVEQLTAFLRENVPSLAIEPNPAMQEQVRLLLQEARSFGMTSEQSVAVYVLTAAQLGVDFVRRFRGAYQIVTAAISQEEKSELLEAFSVNLLDILER